MQKHLEEVLTKTGLTPEQVKSIAELPDDAKDFKPEDHVTAIRGSVETALKNDNAFWEGLDEKNVGQPFLKKIEASQYGRAANIVRTNMLKATGLTDKDFEALGEEGKKIEVFSKEFAKKLSEGKVTDKELQNKLIEANTKIAELEGAAPELETKFKTQYESRAAEDKFDFIVMAQLASLQGLKAPASYISDKIAAKLKSEYAYVVNGTEASLKQKANPQLDILIENGTKRLTLIDAIKKIVTADGLLEPSKSTKEEGKSEIEIDGEKGLKLGHVSDKIKKRLAEEANEGK